MYRPAPPRFTPFVFQGNGPQQQNPNANAQNTPMGQPAPSAQTDSQSQANSGPGGQEMNLASVLHYLQSEWRRWERDRNEWEIERAEMRARIALLEGQRRSAENLKVDLLRRVKMLEYALRQERTKGAIGSRAAGIAPSKLSALQDEEKVLSSRDEKETGSEGSDEGASDRKINGTSPSHKPGSLPARATLDTSAWKSIGGAPRDPKSRARSKEYLKQCLQEITYLTSPGALNPLPPRPPVSANDPAFLEASGDGQVAPVDLSGQERPRKTLPENPPSTTTKTEAKEEPKDEPTDPSSSQPNGADKQPEAPTEVKREAETKAQAEETAQTTSAPAARDSTLSETDSSAVPSEETGDKAPLLTAIYRPESKAAWREELRAANEKAEKIRASQDKVPPELNDEDELANLTLAVEDEDASRGEPESGDRQWTTRQNLKSHLDLVRTVAFGSGTELVLVSGGDDKTVKVWNLDSSGLLAGGKVRSEIEPVVTYRGHSESVTTVLVSSQLGAIYSASLDSTIRVWALPPTSQQAYAPHDPHSAIQTLEGHTDAVWDLVLSTRAGTRSSPHRLISASADGTVKVWTSISQGPWSLTATYTFPDGFIPTSLALLSSNPDKVFIGFTNGLIKLWDLVEGKEERTFGEEIENGHVNAILSHPTLPAIISGHEDGRLRFYDATKSSSTPTSTLLAHPAAITSLSLQPGNPSNILTASSDGSVRLWDLAKKTSIQDLSGHRKRSGEGVCAVDGHVELPVIASAGADGVVRVWTTTRV